MSLVFNRFKSAGVLDYVAAWYWKATQYIDGQNIQAAFVSTNSITQGEQVAVLWRPLVEQHGVNINFAHRTFNWSSEAKGKAAVHVVIIGFAAIDTDKKFIYEYDAINAEPHQVSVININPYLIDFDDIVVISRNKSICAVSEIVRGSETTDDGHLMLSEDEMKMLIDKYPNSRNFIRQFTGGNDILNNKKRWCLWLKDIPVNEYKHIPLVMDKIRAVQEFRKKSGKERTMRAIVFCQIRLSTGQIHKANNQYQKIVKIKLSQAL